MSRHAWLLAFAAGLSSIAGCAPASDEDETPARVVTAHAIAWNGIRPGHSSATAPPTIYVFDAPVGCDALAEQGGFDVDRTLPRPTGPRLELMIELPSWTAGAEAKGIYPTSLDGRGRAEDLSSASGDLALAQRPDGTVAYERRPFELLSAPSDEGAEARARIDVKLTWSRDRQKVRRDVVAGELAVQVCGEMGAKR